MNATNAEGYYNNIVIRINERTVSETLTDVIHLALLIRNNELQKWALLESGGYLDTNPYMNDDITVPEYRTVIGQFYDVQGRILLVEDSKLLFVQQDRLREPISKLEDYASKEGYVTYSDPNRIKLLREYLKVEVHYFSFNTSIIKGILHAIRNQILIRLSDLKLGDISLKTDTHSCPLCNQKEVHLFPVGRKTWYKYECPRCGEFTMTDEARDILPGLRQEDPFILKRLRRYLWNHKSGHKVLISQSSFEAEGYTVIETQSAMELYKDDGSPLHKLDTTLINMARRTERLGLELTGKYRWDIPTLDDDEAVLLLREIIAQDYARGDVLNDISWLVVLTTKGLRYGLELDKINKTLQVDGTTEITNESPRIFLSHSHKDSKFVERLATDLEAVGIRVWYDGWDLEIGHDLTIKIQDGIESSQFLAVVLSPDAEHSAWVEKEWSTALHQELKNRKVKVLPILYRECNKPAFLESKKYADFRDDSHYSDGLAELIRCIRGEKHPRGKQLD